MNSIMIVDYTFIRECNICIFGQEGSMGGLIGGLFIAWILSWFGVDNIIIEGAFYNRMEKCNPDGKKWSTEKESKH